MPVTPLARGTWEVSAAAAQGEARTMPTDVFAVRSPAAVPSPPTSTCCISQQLDESGSVANGPAFLGQRYASRDQTGRVWGVPSAFGRGQCLGCPAKAAPPSMRCLACQCKAAAGIPMPAEQLQALQRALGSLLVHLAPGLLKDVAERLGRLYNLASSGALPPATQAKLAEIANAIDAKNMGFAGKCVAAMVVEHWNSHKDWLIGLKRLVSSK